MWTWLCMTWHPTSKHDSVWLGGIHVNMTHVNMTLYDLAHHTWTWLCMTWPTTCKHDSVWHGLLHMKAHSHVWLSQLTWHVHMCDVTQSYVWHDSFMCDMPHTLHCNTLQHTATHCNTLQHTATHCTTLHHTATHSVTGNTASASTCDTSLLFTSHPPLENKTPASCE